METDEIIKKVRDEIEKCFEKWDERIENGQQPVAIQDLDYWKAQLTKALGDG